MAGIKRKVDASRGSSSQNTVVSESSNHGYTRVTARRGTRIRITTSNTSNSLAEENTFSEATGVTSKSKETTEEQAGASQEPRSKRQKAVPAAELPKPTRSSARIKARADSFSSVESRPQLSNQRSTEETSNSRIVLKNRPKTLTHKNSSKDIIAVAELPSTELADAKDTVENGHTSDETGALVSHPETAPAQKPTEAMAEISPSKGLRGRKRHIEDTSKGGITNTGDSTEAFKRPKIEDDETITKASEDDLANIAQDTEASQNLNSSFKSLLTEASAGSQSTEEVDNATLNQDEGGPTSNTRGRGTRGRSSGRARGNRGRGRGAARGGAPVRGSIRGRGRGGRGGGKGGRRGDDDSDFELERSPSPGPASQKLLDRQKELKQSWKRLAATQRLVLNVLAGRTQQRVARDKNAHRRAPEFEEVQAGLEAALERRLKIVLNEYNLRVEEANTLLEAERTVIEERFIANASHIREELFYAARGDFMTVVEGVQHAEDDEHTEPDVDRAEPAEVADADQKSTFSNYEPLYLDEPRFQRGYNSKSMREPSEAATSDLGKNGWEDFIQRVKMQEIGQEESVPADPDPIQILLQAMDAVVETEPATSAETLPKALSALADAASNAQPVPQQPILAQPQPNQAVTEPPSFLFPRPPVRPILPASHTLPDPFTTGGGPPQLPLPPGVQFTRPGPLPGFIPPHQPAHQPPHHQYHPAPPPYYFPTPPPPPQPSSSPRHQGY